MRKKFIISLALLIFLLGNAPHAGAFFLEDWINDFINPLSPESDTTFSLDSKIELVTDSNNNSVTDGGDIVRFIYTINNPTENEISFVTLNTRVPREYLNFIHNIRGTVNLSDNKKSITIPNLRINPGEKRVISFDARLNYFTDVDQTISTEPDIVTSDKKSLIKSGRKEMKVKVWKGKIPSNLIKKDSKNNATQ